ncbi:pilus assembly protein [Cognatishimia sp. 1_MG-2023]|uniref:TadE/TadG family type IV pilus assembly protein n=1 Tax=Cognatishimia sp. 1_MG-2023 TaxID=3062642 RepID=UPI0026E26429|nr:TadE/TadG family type IV pilus assembly protein [Cognatishimia sp. 1_MG-2023]MDO6725713.1 pilus assembly protein [Cognatishimia sp. 1_MG-2023]
MRMILTHIKNFAKDTKGVVAVEVVIILPILLWAIAAMAIYFDVFRTKSAAEKASYTIGDMLSRETNAITPEYIDNTRLLYEAISRTQVHSDASSGGATGTTTLDPETGLEVPAVEQGTSLRLSVITWNEDESEYELEWSQTRGANFEPLVTADLILLEANLPQMADQDTVILVETSMSYTPVLNVGLGARNIETFTFTRPRYAPQLVYEAS